MSPWYVILINVCDDSMWSMPYCMCDDGMWSTHWYLWFMWWWYYAIYIMVSVWPTWCCYVIYEWLCDLLDDNNDLSCQGFYVMMVCHICFCGYLICHDLMWSMLWCSGAVDDNVITVFVWCMMVVCGVYHTICIVSVIGYVVCVSHCTIIVLYTSSISTVYVVYAKVSI